MLNQRLAVMAVLILGCGGGTTGVPETPSTIAGTAVVEPNAPVGPLQCQECGDSGADSGDMHAGASARVLANLPTRGRTMYTLPAVSWALKPDSDHCGGQAVVVSLATGSKVRPELERLVQLAEPRKPVTKAELLSYVQDIQNAWGDTITAYNDKSLKSLAISVEVSSMVANRLARMPILDGNEIATCDEFARVAESIYTVFVALLSHCHQVSADEGTSTYDAACSQ